MIPERLDDNMTGAQRDGHEFRYRIAAGFVRPGSRVVDAACGTGYGAALIRRGSFIRYVGVDVRPAPDLFVGSYIQADLTGWEPGFPFTVGISFETIEHLDDYTHLIRTLKLADEWVIASVPVVPTVGRNPYHRHDFSPGDLRALIEDDDWRCYQVVDQPSESAEIAVFQRR